MRVHEGSARRFNVKVQHEGSARGFSAKVPHEGSPTRLDRLIHDHVRLGIVSALAANDTLSFAELKAALGATDGNLSVHARRLEEAGYVAVTKGFVDRTPRTEYRLTAAGRRALERYLDHMEAIIRNARRSGA